MCANFSVKDQNVNIVGHTASVTIIQFCHCRSKAALDNR